VLYVPLDVILAETTLVQPDIVYLARDRLTRLSPRGLESPPTLAIEILSPSARTIDRVAAAVQPTRFEPVPSRDHLVRKAFARDHDGIVASVRRLYPTTGG
jgi:putative restriction endonuclease